MGDEFSELEGDVGDLERAFMLQYNEEHGLSFGIQCILRSFGTIGKNNIASSKSTVNTYM